MKKYLFKEFIICTALPFCIPYIGKIPDTWVVQPVKNILICICLGIDLFFAWKYYKRFENEKLKEVSNKINSESYSNACEICKRKRDYIINKTYEKDCHIYQRNGFHMMYIIISLKFATIFVTL